MRDTKYFYGLNKRPILTYMYKYYVSMYKYIIFEYCCKKGK